MSLPIYRCLLQLEKKEFIRRLPSITNEYTVQKQIRSALVSRSSIVRARLTSQRFALRAEALSLVPQLLDLRTQALDLLSVGRPQERELCKFR